MRIKKLAACLAISQSLVTPAWALGLGELQVESSLFQPLVAHIRLSGVSSAELEQMSLRFGSPEEYLRAGKLRPGFLPKVKIATAVDPAGNPVIQLRSQRSFNEPVLDLLIEVTTPQHRVQKFYNLLLDPPNWSAGENNSQPQTIAATSSTPKVISETQTKPSVPSQSSGAKQAQTTATRRSLVNGNRYGPVPNGASISLIAQRTREDASVTIKQMMLAYVHANPHAFQKGNISGLLRGTMLTIPTREQALALSREQAVADVAEHDRAWFSGTDLSVAAVPEKQIDTRPSDVPDAAPVSSEATMRILPPEESELVNASLRAEGAGAGVNESSLQKTALEPDSNTKNSDAGGEALGVMRSQLDFNSERIADFERMLQLKDEQLANAESVIRAQQAEISSQRQMLDLQTEQINQLIQTLKEGQDKPAEPLASDKTIFAVLLALLITVPGLLGLGWFMYRLGARGSREAQPASGVVDQADNTVAAEPASAVEPTETPDPVELNADIMTRPKRDTGFKLSTPLPSLQVEELDQTQAIDEGWNDTVQDAEAEPNKPAVTDDGTKELEMPAANEVAAEPIPQTAEDHQKVLDEVEVCIAYGLLHQGEQSLEEAIEDNPQHVGFRIKLLEVLLMSGKYEDFEAQAAECRWMIDDDTWRGIKDFAVSLGVRAEFFKEIAETSVDDTLLDEDEDTDFFLDDDATVREISQELPGEMDETQEDEDDTVEFDGDATLEDFAEKTVKFPH